MRISPITYTSRIHNVVAQKQNNVKDIYNNIPAQKPDCVSFSGKKINPKRVILILGAPNSGKGTFARKISEQYLIPQISTGDILRKEVNQGTQLGKQAKNYMEQGSLVPDELIMKIFKNRISQTDCKNGFILDGFPRTIKQAKQLDEILRRYKNINLKILNLDVDKSILYARSAARYTCKDCSKTYSIQQGCNPKTLRCDCGGSLIKRTDDTPEVLTQRLENYDKQTFPLLEYYGDKVSNIEIRGHDLPVDVTFAKLIEKLEK